MSEPTQETVRASLDLVFDIMYGWIDDAYGPTKDIEEALGIIADWSEKQLEINTLVESIKQGKTEGEA